MSLGNLHSDPKDPSKKIRTGILGQTVYRNLSDDLRFAGMVAVFGVAIFFTKNKNETVATGTPNAANAMAYRDTASALQDRNYYIGSGLHP